nr:immunoglobulin light chain junction region [Macaca mulatta]MOX51755.1 immunoglobulin light chain junction region [Macaca mulatta]MOX52956.1 immunoglobulin light chain junction region [Macaca mulatta]MOX53557.1 immunoglobulin light chain junction region [Macaca mulatta]MOX53747.1 immunoglobulin light chain junction region [Macaca mulatta]
CMQGREFPLTF